MVPYKKIERQLRKLGYTKNDNISDFWFENKDRLMPIIYGKGHHNEQFSKQVRWKSEIGEVCQEAVRKYINLKIKEHRDKRFNDFDREEFHRNLKDPKYKNNFIISTDLYCNIDFKDFTFNYKNEALTINDFEYLFPGARTNYTDLTGIDLSGVKLEDCVFKNVSFSLSKFDNSYFHQVIFENCHLGYCSFKNAHLVSGNLIHTLISGNFEGATLNVIYPLNDRIIHLPFEIEKIGYFDLLKLSYLFFNSKRNITLMDKKYTHFLANTTNEIESPYLLELKNYIDWYQESFGDPHSPVRNTFAKKFRFFLSVLFTKNWTSIYVLAAWFLLINIFYSALIYFGHSHFRTSSEFFKPDIFQSFYYSMITFSILGYGDLNPIDNWGRILVLSEAIIGYIILGLFIFLLSRKIEKK